MREIILKRGIILIMCLAFQSAAVSAEFVGGTGEPNDPYQIATAEQLVAVGSDPTLMDKHFVLTDDIDLDPNLPGGQVFDEAVLGTLANPFAGVFDGNGHRVFNLTIDGSARLGLIGVIGSEGHVRNLGLPGVRVSGTKAGALVGTNRGSIQNCYATGTVSGRTDSGGLVGENRGSVTGCHSDCDVTGDRVVGGLVGMSREGSVSRSYAIGSVSGSRDVGGLIGRTLRGAIMYCYATGSVDGDSNIGGLVGNSWLATIGWCYANGSVAGVDRVGGLIGGSSGTVHSSFFLEAGPGGGPDNGHGAALTLAQMSQESSFLGWNFYGDSGDGLDKHWFMPPDSSPVLVWQTEITGLIGLPATAGLPWNEAESALKNAGFLVGTVDYDHDRTVPTNHVASVRPAGYAPVGSTIDVVLSNGSYNWADNPGLGSPEEPYQVATAGQLESLADNPELLDRHFVLVNDIDLAGRMYRTALIAPDTDSADQNFQGASFTGSFDGNGLAIRHLTIDPGVLSGHEYVRTDLGLFDKIAPGGEIRNLRLEDVRVSTYLAGSRFYGQIGALAVENEGTIRNCSVAGSIVAGERSGQIGALVGTNKGEIHNSYAGPGMVVGDDDVGGLVGENYEGMLVNCYATMSVEGKRNVGGLVGQNREGTLRSCYAAGLVTGKYDRSSGGLIGNSWPREGVVADCFWNIETAGQLRGGGGMGLTTSEMMDTNVYALNGWAGNPAWIIDDSKDYPHLAWEDAAGVAIPEPALDWLEGAGTADDPHLIATADQLGQIAIASVIFDRHFLLTNDIDLAGMDWRPIGISTGTRFNGTFEGNDHVISNLSMADPNGLRHTGAALFGYTGEQAVVESLTLTNAAVDTGDETEHTSALVANNWGTIKDCHVQATLTGDHCGGLASENAGLILYCTSTCSISADRRLSTVGCLVGENNGGSIFASQATGYITCGDDSTYIGGAVGRNYWNAALVACSADVAVTCGNKSERVGGLVGFNWGTIIANSHAAGPLKAGEQCENIGGLIGENWSNVVNCYASGTVVTGQQIVDFGGLAGGLGSSGKVTTSYFLAPADGGGPDNGIGAALTDQQMRQRASFVGWDFGTEPDDGTGDFWSMRDDGGYPALNLFDGYQPPVLAGAGTLDDPYLIDSAEHLGFAARNPDACYRLVADLDLASIVWSTAAVPLLHGHFDGNGHAIRNLTIADGSYMGLFGTVSAQATVVDLGVLDANIAGPDSSEHIAVMAALNAGTITRCTVTGTVAGDERVGGLAGENDGRITDCYATCSVTGGPRAGGFVGENNGPITTSYVNGEVSSSSNEWGIGAFVGYNYRGSLVNCLWEKRDGMAITTDLCQALTTEQMMDPEIFGLNGWAENPNWVIDSGNDYPSLIWEGAPGQPIPTPVIDWLSGSGTPQAPYRIETVDQLKLLGIASILWDKHFVLTADLDCSGVQFERIGLSSGTGFSGEFDGANHRISNLTLGFDAPRQRYLGLFGYIGPEGSVSHLVIENVHISCGDFSGPVGALAAQNQGRIVNCGVTGLLHCGDACWSVGGLIGISRGTIDNCYADVAISVGDEAQTIGGLAGRNYDSVTNSYASGSVRAGLSVRRLGGLVGDSSGPLVNCYALGDVSRKSAPPNAYPEMGGLVGDRSPGSVVVSCYFLGRNNNLGTQLSDAQMKEQGSFVGWDFVGETANGADDIWWILEGEGYPRLWWE